MTDISENDELSSLGYASSAPDFVGMAPASQTKPQDEADLPALIMVSRILNDRKAFYNSNAALKSRDAKFTIDEQLEITQGMVFHIQELQNLIDTTVRNVKEKLNER